MKKIPSVLLVSITLAIVLAGCAKKCGCRAGTAAPATYAVAEIQPLGGSHVRGQVEFRRVDGGIRISGRVEGLSPNSQHGFHAHEKGDCSASDGMSAGGHFTGGHETHAGLHDPSSHAGDFGNLEANASGVATFDFVKGGDPDFLGRSVIVHRDPDDLKTQPTGASGPRIGCGLILAPSPH